MFTVRVLIAAAIMRLVSIDYLFLCAREQKLASSFPHGIVVVGACLFTRTLLLGELVAVQGS